MSEIRFVNLTPHALTIYKDGEIAYEIPTSGNVARRAVSEEIVGEVNGTTLARTVFGEAEGVPTPEEGVMYVVSRLVKDGLAEREDVICPDTGKTAVRDEGGRILGVTRFTY
jgi:hypothetical protein